MIEDFFRHSCDIYAHTDTDKSAKYGLPIEAGKNRAYPSTPTASAAPCYFTYDGEIVPGEANNAYSRAKEVSLPAGTVITEGDKVVDTRFNQEYTAGFPEDVRGKYVFVPLRKVGGQGDM